MSIILKYCFTSDKQLGLGLNEITALWKHGLTWTTNINDSEISVEESLHQNNLCNHISSIEFWQWCKGQHDFFYFLIDNKVVSMNRIHKLARNHVERSSLARIIAWLQWQTSVSIITHWFDCWALFFNWYNHLNYLTGRVWRNSLELFWGLKFSLRK
jgi:hypothetical protein